MKIFGFEITRTKAAPANLASVSNRGWYRILESFDGAWQNNTEVTVDNVTTHPAVFACITLIASDIAKMRLRLVQQNADGIWQDASNPSFSPVLRKPNHFQNRIQFIESWVYSKLLWGNAYVLKVRDRRQVVTGLYVLDPYCTKPLVAPDGSVFYQVKRDDLSLLPDQNGYIFPASEIIHDRFNTLFHWLVGLSPIYAAGLAAVQGLNIQQNSTNFFGNGSRPGGVLTAPGAISKETAARLKEYFDENFAGDNAGKVAVLGDGLAYEQLSMSAADSQLIEQLKWTVEPICAAYHVPPYMVGLAPPPAYNNIEALNTQYYTQCLQILIEAIELCLDEGLGLTTGDVASQRYGTEFDTEDLLRMDSNTQIKTIREGVQAGVYSPNEGRRKQNLPPVPGGGTPYLQVQNYSLEALNKRDTQADPFSVGEGHSPTVQSPDSKSLASVEPEKTGDNSAVNHRDFLRERLGLVA